MKPGVLTLILKVGLSPTLNTLKRSVSDSLSKRILLQSR